MSTRHPVATTCAALIGLVLLGCANRELRETAGELSQEVSALVNEASAHRKIENARVAGDMQLVSEIGRLTDVQSGLADMDRTVLAMSGTKSPLEAWNALNAHLATVEAEVARRAIEDPAEPKAASKLTPLPTALLAALAKDLEAMAVVPDWKSRIAAFVAYGESVRKKLDELQKEAATQTDQDDKQKEEEAKKQPAASN